VNHSQPHNPSVTITSARESRSADIRRRQTRYLISMGIRTVCFVLAIVVSGPLRWVLVAAALFLPYVAVVIANASERRESEEFTAYVAPSAPQIEGPATRGSEEDRS